MAVALTLWLASDMFTKGGKLSGGRALWPGSMIPGGRLRVSEKKLFGRLLLDRQDGRNFQRLPVPKGDPAPSQTYSEVSQPFGWDHRESTPAEPDCGLSDRAEMLSRR